MPDKIKKMFTDDFMNTLNQHEKSAVVEMRITFNKKRKTINKKRKSVYEPAGLWIVGMTETMKMFYECFGIDPFGCKTSSDKT